MSSKGGRLFRGADRLRPIGQQLVMLALCGVTLLPIYFMIVSALKSEVDYAKRPLGLPTAVTTENFARVIGRSGIVRWSLNSLLLTATSVALALLVSTLAAYALARLRFPGADVLFRLISTLMAVPVISVLIPLFVFMVRTRLVNTYGSAIAVYVGFLIPYKVFFLTAFFRHLPDPVLEAARLDGCGVLGLLRYIVIPLSRTALITMGVVSAVWVWNELLIALVLLQNDATRTLMVGLTVFQDEFRVNVPVTMAGLLIAVVPMIVLYVAGVRHFITGLWAGSTQGE
jgi:raffinose/stachyose/melibiose transport system permease protein